MPSQTPVIREQKRVEIEAEDQGVVSSTLFYLDESYRNPRDLPLSFHNYSPLSLLIFNAIFFCFISHITTQKPIQREVFAV